MRNRVRFWLKVLPQAAASLSSAAGWFGLVVLILGIAAGVVVPVVVHVSHWLTAVILLGLLVVAALEGSYRVWAEQPPTRPSYAALEARHDQSPKSRVAASPAVAQHRIGVRNPADNPPANGVQVQWADMSPRPPNQLGYPDANVVPPQWVPRVSGGDPAAGISLPPGQEESWVIASSLASSDGTRSVGVFAPDLRLGQPWRGYQWRFPPGEQWRFTYRIVAENVPGVDFSMVMTTENGTVRFDLEG